MNIKLWFKLVKRMFCMHNWKHNKLTEKLYEDIKMNDLSNVEDAVIIEETPNIIKFEYVILEGPDGKHALTIVDSQKNEKAILQGTLSECSKVLEEIEAKERNVFGCKILVRKSVEMKND